MGVRGLFQFLRRFERDVVVSEFVKNKSVGVDIFWFIHQSKGDLFALQNWLLPIVNNALMIHCVFDGAAPPEKRAQLAELAKNRAEIMASIQRIEEFLRFPFTRLKGEEKVIIYDYLNQLRKQSWSPSQEFIQEVKSWLLRKGCLVYQAMGEADELLAKLAADGVVSTVVTNDSDLLILGVKSILRMKSPLRGSVYDVSAICSSLGFTAQQWSDFMYLCGHMKETDIVLAYSLISVYKDLEWVLQKWENIYKDSLLIV